MLPRLASERPSRYIVRMNDWLAAVDWNRWAPMAILAACVGALGTAYVAQYGLGLEPCRLCLYQRIPYAGAGLLVFLGLMLPRGPKRAGAVAAAGLVFLIGASIAVHHVGVEQHWWASAAACGGAAPEQLTIEQLRQQLGAKPPKPCDEIDWTLFGVSMATYNVFVSLSLAVASLAAARELSRRA